MKKTLLLCLVLAACATSNKPASTSAESQSSGSEEIDIDNSDSKTPQVVRAAPSAQEVAASHDQLRAALDSGNQKKLEEVASQILAKNPKDTRALNALAVQQIRNNRPWMARVILKKALDIDSRNSQALTNYGVTFLLEKDDKKAMGEFKKALESDPSNSIAASNLGSIHLKARNYQEARRLFEVAYGKSKNNPKVAGNYALALKGTGDFSGSKKVYEQMGAADSKDQQLLLNYAVLLVDGLGDKTKGLEVINRIKFLGSDPAIMERARQLEARLK